MSLSETGHPNGAALLSLTGSGGGGLGWLKCREFGRRGDTARDQVIRASALGTQTCAGRAAQKDRVPKQVLVCPPPSEGEGRTLLASRIRPLIREDYPLSLSISLSGGEETNQDFPSNGERTGKSPA